MPILESFDFASGSDRPGSTRSRWAVTACSLLAALACAPTAPEGPCNVILVCWDTVRSDHLGAYGYDEHPTTPFLDRLAERSIVFSRAYAPASWTKPSVPSYFTGTYPCQHGVYEGSARGEVGAVTDVLPEEATTLAEVFAQNGYQTAAFVKNAQLRLGNGFEQGFELYQDEAGDAREIRWRAVDWLDGVDPDRPFFLYLHCLDAHWPYRVPAEYAGMFAPYDEVRRFHGADSSLRDAINDGQEAFTDEDRQALLSLYDGSLRYLDDQLAQLVEALQLRGLEERTIVCLISDHGEEFGEHGVVGHGNGLWENLLRVPWILHVPGEAARRVDTAVSLVDLSPTLLRAAGLPGPRAVEGIDRLTDAGLDRPIFAEHKTPDRYSQSLLVARTKVTRELRFAASRSRRSFPVAVGERWEAELELRPDGLATATQLKLRDEPSDEPVEVKGVVAALRAGSLQLGPVRVRFEETTERLVPDDAAGVVLSEGQVVKARGVFEGDEFVADRLKLYAAGEAGHLEIRGTVSAVETDTGRLCLGGRWIGFDAGTQFKNAPEKRRLGREEIARALELEADAVADAGFRFEVRAVDLDSDPDELEPPLALLAGDPLADRLERLSRELLRRRVYSSGDHRVLTPEALEDLRAIGYAR